MTIKENGYIIFIRTVTETADIQSSERTDGGCESDAEYILAFHFRVEEGKAYVSSFFRECYVSAEGLMESVSGV